MAYPKTGQELVEQWVANVVIKPAEWMITIMQTLPKEPSVGQAKQ